MDEPRALGEVIDRAERYALLHEPELAALSHEDRRRRIAHAVFRLLARRGQTVPRETRQP